MNHILLETKKDDTLILQANSHFVALMLSKHGANSTYKKWYSKDDDQEIWAEAIANSHFGSEFKAIVTGGLTNALALTNGVYTWAFLEDSNALDLLFQKGEAICLKIIKTLTF